MSLKNAGFVSIGVVAGFFGTMLYQPVEDRRDARVPLPAAVAASSSSVIASLPPAPPQRSASTQADRTKNTKAGEELMSRLQAALAPPPVGAFRDALAQLDSAALLASGMTQERFDWIMLRREEVVARRAMRPASDPYATRYVTDPDLDLRELIGAEEYAQFRVATGRFTTVGVPEVAPGSIAELAGLKPGDEILSYGGKRVFNVHDLDKVASENAAGTQVAVQVQRDGRTFTVAMPAGPLGLRRENVEEMLVRWRRGNAGSNVQ
jgi:membrane-associated protease RseP (regulator of RpoE activity)